MDSHSKVGHSDVATTLRYYVDVALPMALAKGGQTIALWLIGRQTTALWLVFPGDLEEAAEMLAGK